MKKVDADVTIVGAGPGGALLALLLVRLHFSVILLERHEHLNKEFRGEHLNEEGESVLNRVGVFNKIEKLGMLPMNGVEYIDKGKVIKTIDPLNGVDHTGIHVPQNHLLKAIIHEATLYPSFQFHLNSKVTDIIRDSSDKVKGVQATIDGEKCCIESKIIVGADGRFSTIRKVANFPFHKFKHGYDLLWARISTPRDWEPKIKLSLVDNRQVALFTQYGGKIQIGWNIEENSFPTWRKGSFQHFINKLIWAFPELESTVKNQIKTWNDFVLLRVEGSKSDTWVKDSIVLLGDAAHTMSPTGAFGLNCSLKDAEALADVVHSILTNRQPLSYLMKYEQERKPKVEALQLEQLNREATFKVNFLQQKNGIESV